MVNRCGRLTGDSVPRAAIPGKVRKGGPFVSEQRYTFGASLTTVMSFFDRLRTGEAHFVLSTVGGSMESVFPLDPDEPTPAEDAETTRRRFVCRWQESFSTFRGFTLEVRMPQPNGEVWQAWLARIDLTTEREGSCTAILSACEAPLWLGNGQPVPKCVALTGWQIRFITWREMVTIWESGQGAPVGPSEPAKPPPGAGLDAWFDWYHAMKGAGYHCTLGDVARETGYSEGHIKHEHRSYKLRRGRLPQKTH